MLAYYADLAPGAVAEALGSFPVPAHSRLHRALRSLRAALEADARAPRPCRSRRGHPGGERPEEVAGEPRPVRPTDEALGATLRAWLEDEVSALPDGPALPASVRTHVLTRFPTTPQRRRWWARVARPPGRRVAKRRARGHRSDSSREVHHHARSAPARPRGRHRGARGRIRPHGVWSRHGPTGSRRGGDARRGRRRTGQNTTISAAVAAATEGDASACGPAGTSRGSSHAGHLRRRRRRRASAHRSGSTSRMAPLGAPSIGDGPADQGLGSAMYSLLLRTPEASISGLTVRGGARGSRDRRRADWRRRHLRRRRQPAPSAPRATPTWSPAARIPGSGQPHHGWRADRHLRRLGHDWSRQRADRRTPHLGRPGQHRHDPGQRHPRRTRAGRDRPGHRACLIEGNDHTGALRRRSPSASQPDGQANIDHGRHQRIVSRRATHPRGQRCQRHVARGRSSGGNGTVTMTDNRSPANGMGMVRSTGGGGPRSRATPSPRATGRSWTSVLGYHAFRATRSASNATNMVDRARTTPDRTRWEEVCANTPGGWREPGAVRSVAHDPAGPARGRPGRRALPRRGCRSVAARLRGDAPSALPACKAEGGRGWRRGIGSAEDGRR